jgi:glycosyltransferase involved in cell wall biosynthesis
MNFNKCLDQCTGDYIFLLGGDDIFLPGKIKRQVDFMEENPDVFISYHDVSVFNSEKNKHLYFYNKDKHGFHSGDVAILVTQGTFNCGCATAIRNINIPRCDLEIKYSSDWLWYMNILANNGKKIDYFDGIYSKYRRHSKNITSMSKIDCQFYEVFTSLNKIIKTNPELRSQYQVAYSERIFAFSIKYLLAGSFDGFFKCVKSPWVYFKGFYYFFNRFLFNRVA